MWYTREGARSGAVATGDFGEVELSPDGKRAAVERSVRRGEPAGIRLLEFSTGAFSRLTFGSDPAKDPLWSRDGGRAAYNTSPGGEIREITVGSGQERKLFADGNANWVDDWSRDGSMFVIHRDSGRMISTLRYGDRTPQTALQTPFDRDNLRISPDGRWVAYESDEYGRWEIHVASFPSFNKGRR